MTYIQTVPEQLLLFAKSLGFGFLVGVLYDVFALLRRILCRGKGLAVWEVTYAFVAAVGTFLYDLTLNGGRLRLYMLLAQCAGFLLWYYVVGAPFRRAADGVLRAWGRVKERIAVPVRRLHQKTDAQKKKGKEKLKKIFENTNVLLKLRAKLLYNAH